MPDEEFAAMVAPPSPEPGPGGQGREAGALQRISSENAASRPHPLQAFRDLRKGELQSKRSMQGGHFPTPLLNVRLSLATGRPARERHLEAQGILRVKNKKNAMGNFVRSYEVKEPPNP